MFIRAWRLWGSMRRVLLLVLLLALVPPFAAAVDGDILFEMDVSDALDDSRAYPDVRLPQTDISRFTMSREGDDVVQTVHVVGPWPANDYSVEIRNDFGFSESYTMEVERMNSSGSGAKPTDYNTSLFSTLDPGAMGKRVNFTFERTETTMTFRWPAKEIPEKSMCVAPRITTLSRTLVDGATRQVDDDLVVSPSLCDARARTDGMSGTCPAPTSAVVKPLTLEDARDDVREREGNAYRAHSNATLDILSLETRLEDGWVIQTVKLAEDSPRDQVDLTIENQFTGNKSEYESGRKLSVHLLKTSGGGTVPNGTSSNAIHVRAQRVEPAGWELRWCASALPADATCFAPFARASLQNARYQDSVGLAADPCPAPKDDAASTTDEDGADPTPTPSAEGEDSKADADSKGTPSVGLLAMVATGALVALAFRRRA